MVGALAGTTGCQPRDGGVQLGQRAALYCRVSTPEQKPDLQYDGLHGYAARAGLEVADIKTQEMRWAWRSATITISASGAASDVRCSEMSKTAPLSMGGCASPTPATADKT
jgi:hypothetical protein